YNYKMAKFDDHSYDNIFCPSDLEAPNFLLTENGTWKLHSTFPDNFKTTFTVCQKLAIPDTNPPSTTDNPAETTTQAAPAGLSPILIGLIGTLTGLSILIVTMLIKYRRKIKELMEQ
ncbi:hypothetical protein PFISCL1PPCAC_18180, partial [Pristionchus fissidentatus]